MSRRGKVGLLSMNQQETLDPSLIKRDGGTQSRAGINEDTVAEYAESMRDGAKFPAVTVFYDGDGYWLGDGFHRVLAAIEAGVEIAADIRQGTRRDAVLYSAGANAKHGLQRTAEDKRRAVTMLLNDEEWAAWSNYAIAKACAVSESLVRKVRGEISPPTTHETQTRRFERNGKTYEMDVSKVGSAQQERVDDERAAFEALTDLYEGWTVRKLSAVAGGGWIAENEEMRRTVSSVSPSEMADGIMGENMRWQAQKSMEVAEQKQAAPADISLEQMIDMALDVAIRYAEDNELHHSTLLEVAKRNDDVDKIRFEAIRSAAANRAGRCTIRAAEVGIKAAAGVLSDGMIAGSLPKPSFDISDEALERVKASEVKAKLDTTNLQQWTTNYLTNNNIRSESQVDALFAGETVNSIELDGLVTAYNAAADFSGMGHATVDDMTEALAIVAAKFEAEVAGAGAAGDDEQHEWIGKRCYYIRDIDRAPVEVEVSKITDVTAHNWVRWMGGFSATLESEGKTFAWTEAEILELAWNAETKRINELKAKLDERTSNRDGLRKRLTELGQVKLPLGG